MKKLLPLLLIALIGCQQQLDSKLGHDFVESKNKFLSGDYLGQKLPDSIPTLFAPNIVSDGLTNRDLIVSPDGNEIYWTNTTSDYGFTGICMSRRTNNLWSEPVVLSFASQSDQKNIEPCLSKDGNTLYFASNRPLSDTSARNDMNLWRVTRSEKGWSEPEPLPFPINSSMDEYYPSATRDGTIYFTREEAGGINFIYKSALTDSGYNDLEKLPKQVNCGVNRYNAYIHPDEAFIIIPAVGVEEHVRGSNYYISFKLDNGNWTSPVNMGPTVNEDLGRGWSASLSPDGKYLFFMSSKGLDQKATPARLTSEFFESMQGSPQNGNPDIYWVKADFIVRLNPDF